MGMDPVEIEQVVGDPTNGPDRKQFVSDEEKLAPLTVIEVPAVVMVVAIVMYAADCVTVNIVLASPLSPPVVVQEATIVQTVTAYVPGEIVGGTVKDAVSTPPEIEHEVDQGTV